ncbi:MAG: DUF3105 domain-containing protein [Nitrospiria bacterium]
MKKSSGTNRRWMVIAGGMALLAMISMIGVGLKGGGKAPSDERTAQRSDPPGKTGLSPIPVANGGVKIPEGVEIFESEGQEHVADGVHVFYKTDPPTSGPHSNRWLPASIYEIGEAKPELLVHNLEHGNVVIYFDRSALSQSDLEPLVALAKKHIGQWDGILLVGRNDKAHPIILTAWRVLLRLKKVDMERVSSFVDAFRGRGPENPVR